MTQTAGWDQGVCSTLTPQQADAIFFPNSGGKPTKAKALCDTCPIMGMCLKKACEEGLEGFYAGTTQSDRLVISRNYLHYSNKSNPNQTVNNVLPKTVGRRVGYRKVNTEYEDTVDYLDKIESPLT